MNIKIKDALTEVQVKTDDVQTQVRNQKALSGTNYEKSLQAAIDTLNMRLMQATSSFKTFLTEHQHVIRKQEAKKERLGLGSRSNLQ